MKVIIDGQQNTFIDIFRPMIGATSGGSPIFSKVSWQCNTEGNKSAHTFRTHPKKYDKDRPLRTHGHIYSFPS